MTDVLTPQPPQETDLTKPLLNTVLRFATQALEGLDGRSPTLPEPVAKTLNALVSMVAQLQDPDSGWPSDLPQTPETIAPYVAEEIDRVLDAWSETSTTPTTSLLDAIAPGGWSCYPSRYIDLETWRSRLLWTVMQGSAIAMQWMEGLEGTVIQSHDAAPMQGQVRLVPYGILTLDWPIAFDLTTQHPPAALLAPQVLIQSQTAETQGLDQTPRSVEDLLETLLDGLRVTTPRLKALLDGQTVDVLQPGQAWQSGQIQLQFGFEFIPHAVSTVHGVATPTSSSSLTTRFTLQEPGQTALRAAVIDHQRRGAIAQRAESWQAIARMPTAQSVGNWVYQACHITERLRHPALTYHQTLLHDTILLSHWQRWLLWHLSRSAYPVMQLLGGISVQLLQPGAPWQAGTLRLWAGLHVMTERQPRLIDLTTGYVQDQPHPSIHSDAIARPALGGRSDIIPVNALQTAVLEQCCHTPLLEQLRSPLPVDLWEAESDRPIPATLQLDLHLEFWDIPLR